MIQNKGLAIRQLCVTVEQKEILKESTLSIKPGEIHVLMGPNGSGKSTLAYTIAGHPHYKITQGTIEYNGKDLLKLKPHERAREGIFLAFQHPIEVEGVTLSNFLYTILKQQKKELTLPEFKKQLDAALKELNIDATFLYRHLNVGFSGGEKKRAEMIQLLMLRPKFAILDEPDSGADIDTIKTFVSLIKKLAKEGTAFLIISHYQHLLKEIEPTQVHLLIDGTIVESGKKELAEKIEKRGYEGFKEDARAQVH